MGNRVQYEGRRFGMLTVLASVTKLEAHEPDQVRWLRSIGCSVSDIKSMFDVSGNTVYRVLAGDLWR